ncbi:MAG: family 20 glycosylhydrolase [Alistipes sp.]|nr:family 20 glycosylhydrolase [Alistipes sp.]
MKLRTIILSALAMISMCVAWAQPSIVPTPQHYNATSGEFVLSVYDKISAMSNDLLPIANYAAEHLNVGVDRVGRIVLAIDTKLKSEEYRLDVTTNRIEIRGGDYGGVFNGVTTLFQLLPAAVYDRLALPASIDCCSVVDAPRYAYRGFMLDVCRTWIEKEAIMEYIDLLAYHKINKLRLHLTDDEAWRLEIKSHPELAKTGGFRGCDSPIWPRYGKWNEKWGGYYTHEDMREIIDYARVRNIELIPEIDLPGHSLAMASMHPEILCRYSPNLEASYGYDTRSAFCVSNEANYKLLADIIAEVCNLFDTKYIHIGGDEVETSQWKRCPDCQALMTKMGYTSPKQLQAYFMRRIADMLAKHGKLPAVWNEAIDGGEMPSSTLVFGWMGVKECRASAAKGYKTIVMPGQYFYFDMKQSKREPGHDWAAIFDWSKTYGVTPTSLGFTAEEQKNIVGFEASFFSEAYVSRSPEKPDYLHYMTFPRMLSLAEIAWVKSDSRDKSKFYDAMVKHYARLDAMGVAYRLMPPKVSYYNGVLMASCDDSSTIYVRNHVDGSESIYTKPITTSHPERYSFVSRRAKASSPEAAVEGHFRVLKPQFTITSSMPQHSTMTFAKAQGYGRLARTSRSCTDGDWIQFAFAQPVKCRKMQVATGNFQLPRFIFENGYAEISYDGMTFSYGGKLENGMFIIDNPERPIKAVRLVCTSQGNGAKHVSIQPPTIWPVLE